MKPAAPRTQPDLLPSALASPAVADVAVVICTRNGYSRGFLNDAMTSVLQQTVAPAEVIVVDDGSTDATAAEIQTTYPGVTVLKNAGTGLAAARNTGVRMARSSWVSFMDDDDIWVSTKLSEQLAQISACVEPESKIWSPRLAFFKDKESRAAVPRAVPVQFASWPECLLKCPVSTSGALISKSLIRRMGSFDESISWGSAYEYWIRCVAAGVTVSYSDNILCLYRQHDNQMTVSGVLAGELSLNRFLLPHFETLPEKLSSRFRMARLLLSLRNVVVHGGLKSAARYWAETSLRPAHFNARAILFFLLDSCGAKASDAIKRWFRDTAVRVLRNS